MTTLDMTPDKVLALRDAEHSDEDKLSAVLGLIQAGLRCSAIVDEAACSWFRALGSLAKPAGQKLADAGYYVEFYPERPAEGRTAYLFVSAPLPGRGGQLKEPEETT